MQHYTIKYSIKCCNWGSCFKIRVLASDRESAIELALTDLSNIFRRDHIEILDTVEGKESKNYR
jgi:hypothetical protein